MRMLAFMIPLSCAGYVAWKYALDAVARRAINVFLRNNVWVFVLIAVLLTLCAYASWLFALNGPTIKFL